MSMYVHLGQPLFVEPVTVRPLRALQFAGHVPGGLVVGGGGGAVDEGGAVVVGGTLGEGAGAAVVGGGTTMPGRETPAQL